MMKINHLVFLMLLCFGITAAAMPAKPGWTTVTQSDGSTLQVQVVGNAFNNAILTRDGLTVARGNDGDFYYTSSLTGLTAVRAHEQNKRSASEQAFVNVERSHLKMAYKPYRLPDQSGKLRATGSNASSGVPALGERRIPIILVEFADKKFNNTRERIIDAMLTGSESVGQYFLDQSNGQYRPVFDVHGIYTLSQDREYYGGHSGTTKDKGIGWMVTEACQLAAADGVSFQPYDTNNDYYCDVVIIIFAGVGESQAATSHPEAIWPCNWTLEAAKYYSRGGNGPFSPGPNDPYVNHFAVFNELHGSNEKSKTIDGIGTFVHEFGHCLGLPDMYDTGNRDHYGMGNWDVMCQGCYNNDTYTPVGYSAYEKVFMGWVKFVNPQPDTYYTLPVWNQKSANTDKAVCVVSPINKNEYFIFENRKRQGWDRFIAGEGILVTHVTYKEGRWTNNTPNNEDIQLVTLLPADNKLSKYSENGDLWPYGYKNAVTDESTPATVLYMTSGGTITGDAGYLGKPVTEMVINKDGTASFWYMKKPDVKPVISASVDEISFGNVVKNTTSSKELTVKGLDLKGDITVTLSDANGVFQSSPAVINETEAAKGKTVNIQFTPRSTQDYEATLTLSSPEAEEVVIKITGHGALESYVPEMQPADEQYINISRFRADWTDKTPAENIKSYTLEVSSQSSVQSNHAFRLGASESGDATYRLISGITDKYYTVTGLKDAGTFAYRVKALYVDDTESAWSNVMSVTLFDNGHLYASGDVNHDGGMDIDDVTSLIDFILGNGEDVCAECANVDGMGAIDIDDVIVLINIVLGL